MNRLHPSGPEDDLIKIVKKEVISYLRVGEHRGSGSELPCFGRRTKAELECSRQSGSAPSRTGSRRKRLSLRESTNQPFELNTN